MSDTEKPTAPDGAAAEAGAAEPRAAAPPAEPPAPRPARGGRISGGLAFIFAFLALLASGYLWYALIYERPELTRLDLPQALADLERRNEELRAARAALGTALAEVEGRVDALGDTQRTLKAAIDNLRADVGRSQGEWQVAEAEQLLLIANRRLQLARDADTALAALRAADRRIERLADPALLPVRREVAREIAALEALERADITGIALRLASLAEGVDRLAVDPDLQRRAEQVAATGGETAAGGGVWQDLLSLVRVRRHDVPQKPLLAPEQRYFARENLRLMLYGAQHALLAGEVATYEQNLATANRWLGDYFDVEAAAVRAAREEIGKLQAAQVAAELPDISASLEMLRRAAAQRRDES